MCLVQNVKMDPILTKSPTYNSPWFFSKLAYFDPTKVFKLNT